MAEVGYEGGSGKPVTNPQRTGFRQTPILVVLIGLLLIGGWWYLHHGTKAAVTFKDATRVARDPATLRIHGSDTIGDALAPALAVGFLKSLQATDIRIKPLGKGESDIEGTVPGESKPFVIEISAQGSKFAFLDLAARQADIGMASQKIKPEELLATAALGRLNSPESEHVVGLDGVAMIVNKSNPISELTEERLGQILTGSITDWSEAGGKPGVIRVVALDEHSGTFGFIRSKLLNGKSVVGTARRLSDHRDVSSTVANDEAGIGFVGLPFILDAKAIAVSETQSGKRGTISTIPLYPNRLTVATEDYPLSRRLFLYTPSNPDNPWTRKFIQFALSKSGQSIVGDSGFVSQTPILTEPDCTHCPERYRELTHNRLRVSTNFHFETGQSQLQDKAILDVGRVVDELVDLTHTGDGVMLLGFADNVGSADACLRLSKDRAAVVAKEFHKHGIDAEVVDGMGSEMPIASNDNSVGQEKNRRVEIWVTKHSN